jgi:hypothetical protein
MPRNRVAADVGFGASPNRCAASARFALKTTHVTVFVRKGLSRRCLIGMAIAIRGRIVDAWIKSVERNSRGHTEIVAGSWLQANH